MPPHARSRLLAGVTGAALVSLSVVPSAFALDVDLGLARVTSAESGVSVSATTGPLTEPVTGGSVDVSVSTTPQPDEPNPVPEPPPAPQPDPEPPAPPPAPAPDPEPPVNPTPGTAPAPGTPRPPAPVTPESGPTAEPPPISADQPSVPGEFDQGGAAPAAPLDALDAGSLDAAADSSTESTTGSTTGTTTAGAPMTGGAVGDLTARTPPGPLAGRIVLAEALGAIPPMAAPEPFPYAPWVLSAVALLALVVLAFAARPSAGSSGRPGPVSALPDARERALGYRRRP